jgi:hypothetical protein
MLAKIAKIANRLDSLGLTKEADILDAYLAKTAGIFDGFISKFPPPAIQGLFKTWLNASHLGNMAWLGSVLGGGVGSFIPTSGHTQETEDAIAGIWTICDYTRKELQRDSGNDLYMWYIDNVHDASVFGGDANRFLADDLKSLAETIKGVTPDLTQRLPDIAEKYLRLADHLEGTADLWMVRDPNKKPSAAPASAPSPKSEGPAVAIESSSISPKPVAPSVSSPASDPWSVYGADAKKLKAAWLVRTSATKKNPSFENFQAWLRSRTVDPKDVFAIMDRLVAETSHAGMPSAAEKMRNITFSEAK